jgi:hypothetical protein
MSEISIITNAKDLPAGWLAMFACSSVEAAQQIAARYNQPAYYLKQNNGGHLFIVKENEKDEA